jgi:hypothetical protein
MYMKNLLITEEKIKDCSKENPMTNRLKNDYNICSINLNERKKKEKRISAQSSPIINVN